jgi:hypothetical protein
MHGRGSVTFRVTHPSASPRRHAPRTGIPAGFALILTVIFAAGCGPGTATVGMSLSATARPELNGPPGAPRATAWQATASS